jgi:hypothetical protein
MHASTMVSSRTSSVAVLVALGPLETVLGVAWLLLALLLVLVGGLIGSAARIAASMASKSSSAFLLSFFGILSRMMMLYNRFGQRSVVEWG